MRNLNLFLILLTINLCPTFADNVKNVTLTFDKTDFSYDINSSGETLVLSIGKVASYLESENTLGLPYLSYDIPISENETYKDIKYSIEKEKIIDNCNIAAAPQQIPSNKTANETETSNCRNESINNQFVNVKYAGEYIRQGEKIITFNICPFIYDNRNKQLLFINKIDLKIKLQDSDISNETDNNDREFNLLEGVPEIAKYSNELIYNPIYDEKHLDYVIITKKELEDSFIPIMAWKNEKGVRTGIMSVEEINYRYRTANSLQEKIKLFLSDMYEYRNLKYAMLGGDDQIVPVQYCYSIYQDEENGERLPTDLYYACFNGRFDWDGNENGTYGEIYDNIYMYPNIYLTRLPIRTKKDIEAYTQKLLAYEKYEKIDTYKNNMIMCGNQLCPTKYLIGDAEKKGNNLYNYYIKDYWNGDMYKLYDSYSDFGEKYQINRDNLQEQFSHGYSFIDFISHGSKTAWKLENDGTYSNNDAMKLKSDGYTIITTNSCLTNYFDCNETDGPCLSEAFIRNENSGVIAYLGCSREGWYSIGKPSLGASLLYEAQYYRNLFSPNIKDKNFGKIVAYAKIDMMGFCYSYTPERWVQFGLNPVGDPEMPVYTNKPTVFDKVTITVDKNSLTVNTGVDSCKICVMSKFDNGKSFYEVANNVKSAKFQTSIDSLTVCITKQNYKPRIINNIIHPKDDLSVKIIGDSSKITDIAGGFYPGDFSIGYHVDNNANSAKAVISTLNGNIIHSKELTPGDGKIKFTTPIKGIISVSLFVNGKLEDSIHINNK